MNDEHKMNADDPSDAIATSAQQDPRPRRPGGTKRWFRVAALLGLGAIGGGIATGTLTAYAHGGMRMMWQNSGPHGHSVEQVRERVADGAAWVVGAVDATPEQKVAIKTIMSATVDDVYPLMQLHRGNRRELITLLAKPQMDADAVEQLRRSELQVFDAASKRLADALTKASTVLTPEQRQQLVAMAAGHRH